MIDPVSYAAGRNRSSADVDAAERAGRRKTMAALDSAIEGHERANHLQAELDNCWIPYAIGLKASLQARRVERQILIDELKRLDPVNAAAVEQRAEQARLQEYRSLEGDKLQPIVKEVMEDSEKRRLDR